MNRIVAITLLCAAATAHAQPPIPNYYSFGLEVSPAGKATELVRFEMPNGTVYVDGKLVNSRAAFQAALRQLEKDGRLHILMFVKSGVRT